MYGMAQGSHTMLCFVVKAIIASKITDIVANVTMGPSLLNTHNRNIIQVYFRRNKENLRGMVLYAFFLS